MKKYPSNIETAEINIWGKTDIMTAPISSSKLVIEDNWFTPV